MDRTSIPFRRMHPTFVLLDESWDEYRGILCDEYYYWGNPETPTDPETKSALEFGSMEHVKIGVKLGFIKSVSAWKKHIDSLCDQEYIDAIVKKTLELRDAHDAYTKQYLELLTKQSQLSWDDHIIYEGKKYGLQEFTYMIHNDPACNNGIRHEDGDYVTCSGCAYRRAL